MFFRLNLHFFGGIFIMLCQILMVATSSGALNRLGHVHRVWVDCAGTQ